MIRFNHNYGFFSFCSRLLEEIIQFINTNQRPPTQEEMDLRDNLGWYKPPEQANQSIFNNFFKCPQGTLAYKHLIEFSNDDQYKLFSSLPLGDLIPIVRTFFEPTEEIQQMQAQMELEFNLHDYSNICCLFYRGNDKITETILSSYDDYIRIGTMIQNQNPNVRFLVQSDETEFITTMTQTFPNTIVLHGHIRHVPRNGGVQVDKLCHPSMNYESIKRYIAITCIMSKCDQIVTQSGNCGLWIIMMRGHARRIHQFVNKRWYVNECMFEKGMTDRF